MGGIRGMRAAWPLLAAFAAVVATAGAVDRTGDMCSTYTSCFSCLCPESGGVGPGGANGTGLGERQCDSRCSWCGGECTRARASAAGCRDGRDISIVPGTPDSSVLARAEEGCLSGGHPAGGAIAALVLMLTFGFLFAGLWMCITLRHRRQLPRRAQKQRDTAALVLDQGRRWADEAAGSGSPGERVLWVGLNGWTPPASRHINAAGSAKCSCCCSAVVVPVLLAYTVPAFVWLGVGISSSPDVGFWLSTMLPFGILTVLNCIFLPLAACVKDFTIGCTQEFPTNTVYVVTTHRCIDIRVHGLADLFNRHGKRTPALPLRGGMTAIDIADTCEPMAEQYPPFSVRIRAGGVFSRGKVWQAIYNEDGAMLAAMAALQTARRGQAGDHGGASGGYVPPHHSTVPVKGGAGAPLPPAPPAPSAPPAVAEEPKDTVFCGRCGAASVAGDAFCRGCGSQLASAPPADAPAGDSQLPPA